MRLRTRLSVVAAVITAVGLGGACRDPISHATPEAVSPGLASLIGATTDPVFVVVQFAEAATTADVLAGRIKALGAGARALRQLPFVGALATPTQVNAIAALPGSSFS